MARVGVTMTGNWKALRNIVDASKLEKRIEKALKAATVANAQLVQDAIKRNILKGTYARGLAPNAKLTVEIKHGRRPLVDHKGLWRSISYDIQGPYRAEVGVPSLSPSAGIAVINHEGATIPVTPAMRAMFKALALASDSSSSVGPGGLSARAAVLFLRKPDGWKPLRDSTTVIRIPARPFVKDVVENKPIQDMVGLNWMEAARYAVADLPMKPGLLRRKA